MALVESITPAKRIILVSVSQNSLSRVNELIQRKKKKL